MEMCRDKDTVLLHDNSGWWMATGSAWVFVEHAGGSSLHLACVALAAPEEQTARHIRNAS